MFILYRMCLGVIICRVRIKPDYFKALCRILIMRSCYESLVKSMVTCYSVYKNKLQIKKYIEIEKVPTHLKTKYEELQKKNIEFINELRNYLALKDCPSHSELYDHIRKSEDEILRISSPVNYLPGIKSYRDYVKKMYAGKVEVVQDTLNINIHQFVNLSLIKPQDQESSSEYFEALKDPYHLIFNHNRYTKNTTTPLKELADVFDTSGSVTEKILIQGSPGSGKTTLANKICIEWAKGNLINHYILVILLSLRDIYYIDSIDKMVECTMTTGDSIPGVVRDITYIEGKNILLLLEGWDELPVYMQKKSFFVDIISGKALKNASVLITTRPSSIGSIEKRFITRNVAILGFSEDQIEQYVDQCFVDSSHGPKDTSKSGFMVQLQSNPVLKSLAYVPVNLSILVHVFEKYKLLPSTLTKLYQQYVLLKLRLHNQRKTGKDNKSITDLNSLPDNISESLKKLCELAYDGIKKQKLDLTESDIKPLDYDGMGLLQVNNYMLRRGSNKTYEFIHKTVQEFLAARHLTTIPEHEQKDIFLKNKLKEDFVQVLLFYAGITGLKPFNVKELFPTNSTGKKSWCTKIYDFFLPVVGPLVIKSDGVRLAGMIEMAEEFSEHNDNNEMCVLISYIAEAKNEEACKAFSNNEKFHKEFCCVNIPHSATSSQLLVSLSYCIAHSGRGWIIRCTNKILGESDILSLQKCIDSNDTPGKLVSLGTKTNREQINFLTTFLKPQFPLLELILSGSDDFDDDCVNILCSALQSNHTLILLELAKCKISSEGIRTIAKMLQVNKALQYIDLIENCFSQDDLSKALVMMKNNTTLVWMNVKRHFFEDERVKKELETLNKNRKTLLELDVYKTFRFGGLLSKLKMLEWTYVA